MKKIILALALVVLLVPGCCAVSKMAVEKNLKAWRHIDTEYRGYVNADDELEKDDKEDLLLLVDEAVLHAEEMVKTVTGEEKKKEGEE